MSEILRGVGDLYSVSGASPIWVITSCVDFIRMGGAGSRASQVFMGSYEESREGVHRMTRTQQGMWNDEVLRTSKYPWQTPVFRRSTIQGV